MKPIEAIYNQAGETESQANFPNVRCVIVAFVTDTLGIVKAVCYSKSPNALGMTGNVFTADLRNLRVLA